MNGGLWLAFFLTLSSSSMLVECAGGRFFENSNEMGEMMKRFYNFEAKRGGGRLFSWHPTLRNFYYSKFSPVEASEEDGEKGVAKRPGGYFRHETLPEETKPAYLERFMEHK